MKKTAFMIFVLVFTSFCFLNAEENNDMEELQNQLLEILNDESEKNNKSDTLEILQENNEDYGQKNEEITQEEEKKIAAEKEKKKADKKGRKQNIDMLPQYFFGVNFPFMYNEGNSLDNLFGTKSFGVSLGALSSMNFLSFKFNINYDFNINEAISEAGSYFLSFGISPVYNSDFFFGCYFSLGWENIDKYSFTNIGTSSTMIFRCVKLLKIYINVDATYRYPDSKKETPEKLVCLVNTWRISPTLGLCFGF